MRRWLIFFLVMLFYVCVNAIPAPAGISVRLEQDGSEIARIQTNESGEYRLIASPMQGAYDVCAEVGERGYLRSGIFLREGEHRTLNLELGKASRVEGTLLMMDSKTPHVNVPVQAIRDGEVVATTLSDKGGAYSFVNLKPGEYQVRCQVLGGYVYYGEEKAGKPENGTMSGKPISLQIKQGESLENIDFRIAPFKKGNWRNYTHIDGLAHPAVTSIYCAPNGEMWFGTGAYPIGGSGVSRYDGKKFTNFTTEDGLVGNWISAIHGSSDGVIWFGTENNGISRYDGEKFVNFTTEDGLADNWIKAVYCASNGATWFGTPKGVSRYDGTKFYEPLTTEDGLVHNDVRAIYCDPDGVMWFGTKGGVSRYDEKGFVNLKTEDGLIHNNVKAICCDPDGVMWFGTQDGISRYDGNGFANLTEKDGLIYNIVKAICCDTEGIMWFGTTRGVSRYDGETFVNFTTEDGLINNDVNAVQITADGAIWFGTSGGWSGGGGVSRYDEKTIINFTKEDGLARNRILDIHLAGDGVMWIGTGNGISRYDGRQFFSFSAPEDEILSICSDSSDVIWAGGFGGGFRYDGMRFVQFRGGDTTAIYRAPDDAMWIGTWGSGVFRYDSNGESFVQFTKDKDGLADDQFSAGDVIDCNADGVIWFGTWNGVSRYDGTKFHKPLTRDDGLADNRIVSVHCADDGVVWFGTMGGLFRYDGKKFTNFTAKDGLARGLGPIHFEPDGIMWFGASLYDGNAWSSLDTRDGLAGDTVISIRQDSDGFLWLATEGGLTRYKRSTNPPHVQIVSITTDETYEYLSAVPAFGIGARVTIGYNAIDLKTIPEKRQYQCRIQVFGKSLSKKEIDTDWQKPTRATSFDYTFREPGAYTFQVRAIDRDLNYSDPASVEIEIIPPPFYTRAWFIIGAILAAFFIPTAAYAIILTKQKKQDFQPLANPYIVSNPIRSKEMFFGRRSDFEFIRIKLGAGKAGLVVVFAGERRSGKTSILFQILNGELGERIVPVLLDMQAMTVDSEVEFLGKMASEISEALVRVSLKPPTVDFGEGSSVRILEGFVSEVMETLEGKELLLLIDEYELIESKIDDGVLSSDIITLFASLLEAHPRLSFIFTGSRHLEQRNPDYWRILIGKSLYWHISFLSERDAVRLITEPAKESVIYPVGIPESIIRLTAGQPFYTQVVCQNLIDRLNEVKRNRVRQEDVDAVAQELADNPLPQMIYFWDDLESDQQSALSLLGEVLEDSNRYASARMLLDFAREQELTFQLELSALERILDDLFMHEVLERERAGEGKYKYRFRVDLFRIWARQAHSVWQSA